MPSYSLSLNNWIKSALFNEEYPVNPLSLANSLNCATVIDS